MNRKKKRNTILKKRLKKAKAKLAPKSHSAYIAKADREPSTQEQEKEQEQEQEKGTETPPD